MVSKIVSMALFAFGLMSCAVFDSEKPQPGCERVGNVQGVCGFPAPEDIDVFDGGRYLLFSPVTGINGTEREKLYLFDTESLSAVPITYQLAKSSERWGEDDCISPPEEEFSPHGVHISQRTDGRWQVLAVNHLREAVEMFEVVAGEVPSLIWRGCALGSANANFNDVVALPDGGFFVSHMFDRGSMDVQVAMASTVNTGYVMSWTKASGYKKLKGSDGIVPNGLAISTDGASLFIAETGGKRIRKINISSGEETGEVVLGPVDNLSWSADGKLIATRIVGAMPHDCFSKPGPCLTPFEVVAINPDTLEFEVMHEQRGKPMGTASVAVVHGDAIYVGSFKGHQIMRVIPH